MTRMVQVAVAGDITEAEELQTILRDAGIPSELSAAEDAVLRLFEANPRPLRRRQEFITEGRKYQNLFVILEGISIRFRVLRNGTRQIIGILLRRMSLEVARP